MATIFNILNGIGPLLNEILSLSMIFAYIGVALWAVTSIAPKPRGLGLRLFKGRKKRFRRRRRW